MKSLKILLIGSGIGDHFWALHVNRYTRALTEIGHYVTPMAWSEVQHTFAAYIGRDLLILQDTHLALPFAIDLRNKNECTVLLTHSEMIQGERDKGYITRLKPHYIFTDTPRGVKIFEPLGIKAKWMAHGADSICYRRDDKDIDVLWIGHKYAARDGLVQSQVVPLMKTRYNVLMHGAGYVHGSVAPSVMFALLARTKVVINIGHPVTYEGGYSGTRISDAIASGAFVVSTKYPRAEERYPHGALFVEDDAIQDTVLEILLNWSGYFEEKADDGYRFVRQHRMAHHDMEMMLESLYGEDT